MDWTLIIAGGALIVAVTSFILRVGDNYPSHREHADLKDRVTRLEDNMLIRLAHTDPKSRRLT